ncbi:MAG: hypothetical protein U5R31_06855 [Acidimicrobiia bacterium]|nr:hypothetical protein [Acidimicrobiia bacterium]
MARPAAVLLVLAALVGPAAPPAVRPGRRGFRGRPRRGDPGRRAARPDPGRLRRAVGRPGRARGRGGADPPARQFRCGGRRRAVRRRPRPHDHRGRDPGGGLGRHERCGRLRRRRRAGGHRRAVRHGPRHPARPDGQPDPPRGRVRPAVR